MAFQQQLWLHYWYALLLLILLLLVVFLAVGNGSEHTHHHTHEHWLVDYLATDIPRSSLVNFDNDPTGRKSLPTAHRLYEDNSQYTSSYFHPKDYTKLQSIFHSFKRYSTQYPWVSSNISEISNTHPFIFFHQRKSGGTSLRATLEDVASEIGLNYFIPCANGVDCDTYTFPLTNAPTQYAIFAGHFKWGVQSDFTRYSPTDSTIQHTLRKEFSCITNYRHPIDRIESCLYFRFEKQLQGKCLMDMSIEQLHTILYWIDQFGTSCLNEPFRMMSGYQDEDVIDSLMIGIEKNGDEHLLGSVRRGLQEHNSGGGTTQVHSSRHYQHHLPSYPRLHRDSNQSLVATLSTIQALQQSGMNSLLPSLSPTMMPTLTPTLAPSYPPIPPSFLTVSPQQIHPLAIPIVASTLTNAKQCSPLILEIPESYTLAAKRFPELGKRGGFIANRKTNVNIGHERCQSLSGERRVLVRRAAALELLVYELLYNQTMIHLLHDHSIDAPWFYFLRTCVYNPALSIRTSAIPSMLRELSVNDMIMTSVTHPDTNSSATFGPFSTPTVSPLPPHRIPFIIVTATQQQRNELKSMIELATGYTTGTIYESIDPSRYFRYTPSQRSDYEKSIPILQSTCQREHKTVFADAGFFNLVSNEIQAEIGFDKHYMPQSMLTSCAEGEGDVPLFDKMAVIVRDPFYHIWKDVILPIVGRENVTILPKNDKESLLTRLHRMKVSYKTLHTTTSRLRGSYRDSTSNDVMCHINRLMESNLPYYSHLTVAPTISPTLSPSDTSTVSPSLSPNTSSTSNCYNHYLSLSPDDHSILFKVNETLMEHHVPVSLIEQYLTHLREYVRAFHTAMAFNTMRDGQKDSRTHSDESVFYREYYSLFFNELQYHSLFHTHYLALLTPFLSLSPFLSEDERTRAKHIGYTVGDKVRYDERVRVRESGRENGYKFEFFSYESLMDETFAHQMSALLKDYHLDTLVQSKLTPSPTLSPTDQTLPHGWKHALTTNAFTSLLHYGSISNTTTKLRSQCAFGSANTVDKDLVISLIPMMKAFYAVNPEILIVVREIVRENLQVIGINNSQMHLLYKIEREDRDKVERLKGEKEKENDSGIEKVNKGVRESKTVKGKDLGKDGKRDDKTKGKGNKSTTSWF